MTIASRARMADSCITRRLRSNLPNATKSPGPLTRPSITIDGSWWSWFRRTGMGPCLNSNTVRGLRVGTLSPHLRSVAVAHVRECDRCRRRLDEGSPNDYFKSCLAEEYPPTISTPHDAPANGVTPAGRAFPATPSSGFPGYEVLSEIQHGGQGIIYRARQLATGRIVALKVLLRGTSASPDERARFHREIAVVARLRHPHVVTIYESGAVDDFSYFAMEYIEGVSLDSWVTGQSPPIEERVRLLASVCEAVGYAHAQGVVHRDLKPGNVLIDSRGEPHVLDFGLAKIVGLQFPDFDERFSQPGQFLGTLPYASPEQASGDRDAIDARTDVYSLGVLLYESLTSHRPFPLGPDLRSALQAIADTEPTPPSALDPNIDDELETIVLKALSKDRSRRYMSALEMADDLARYLEGSPILAKRDRFTYRIRKQLTRAASRSLALTSSIVVLLAVALGHAIHSYGVAVRWADDSFDAFVQPIMGAGSGLRDDVVVVVFDDETIRRMPELAKQASLSDVDSEPPASWRRIHGAFLERLSAARPKVVSWDFAFVGDQPRHDPYFARGIDALRASGSRLVFAIDEVDANGRPDLCRAVADRADGRGWLFLAQRNSWGMVAGAALAIEDEGTTAPSLALMTYALATHPDRVASFNWQFKPRRQYIDTSYQTSSGSTQAGRQPEESDRVFFANVNSECQDGLPAGVVHENRDAACSLTILPPAEDLARHTVPYHAVFELDDAHLRARFDGSVVLVGNTQLKTRRTPDVRRLAARDSSSGRDEFSCFMHAAAISDLLSGFEPTRPGEPLLVLLLGLGAGGGFFVGMRLGRRRPAIRVPLAAIACSVCIVAVGVAIAVAFNSLIAPTGIVVSTWVALAAAAWFAHEATARPIRPRSTQFLVSPHPRAT
ncbi:MAG: protein kinase [Planctomycetes bacterium]|nr:protein kinase [Planctomycetota bacterium]